MQLLHFDLLIFHKLRGHPRRNSLFTLTYLYIYAKIIFLDIPLLQSILVLPPQQLLYLPYM